jgi:hypothetical protein
MKEWDSIGNHHVSRNLLGYIQSMKHSMVLSIIKCISTTN